MRPDKRFSAFITGMAPRIAAGTENNTLKSS
jgi:hypothetical protein